MNGDIYWSHVCISSLKANNVKTFEYGLSFIVDLKRKQTLKNIFKQYNNNEPKIMNIINNFHSSVPVIVA